MDDKLIRKCYFSSDIKNYPEHHHNSHEIIFVKKGEAVLTCANKVYTLKKNSLVFISNLEPHDIRVKSDEYERYCIQITPTAVRSAIKSNILSSVFSLRPKNFCHVIDVAPIFYKTEHIFMQMIEAEQNEYPFLYDFQKSLFRILLIELYNLDKAFFPVADSTTISVIEKIQIDLETNYSEQFTLDELAKKYNVSVSYLSHLFKDITGYGVIEYLTELRISIAKEMLLHTKLSANEISNEIGFSSSSNFSRYFKKTIGMTPLHYRKAFCPKREGAISKKD